jgi:hypothetical protein
MPPHGLAALAAAGERHALKRLDVSHCSMRDVGAACVAVMMLAGNKLEKVGGVRECGGSVGGFGGCGGTAVLVACHETFALQVSISWNSISSAGCGYIAEGINACRWLDEFKIGHNW